MKPASTRSSLLTVVLVLFGIAGPAYAGVYVWARVTHRLVNYGSFIARPHALSGFGWSDWEIAFFPLIQSETALRSLCFILAAA